MSNLRLKRGTTTQNNGYLGPLGELTVDTDLKELRLHDGTTTGGIPISKKDHFHVLPVVNVTSNYTASRGQYCLVQNAGLTVTLPANPNVGDWLYIGVLDFTNTNVARNGQKIMGLNEDMTIDASNISIQFVFTGSTYGWKFI